MGRAGHLHTGLTSVGVFFLLVGLVYYVISGNQSPHPLGRDEQFEASSKYGDKSFHAPARNPWAELEETEASEIYTFLHQGSNPLNLTTSAAGDRGGNAIYLMETLRPNKSSAVDYLDIQGPSPERWARVSVLESQDSQAFFTDYMVGPLPPSNVTTIIPLTYCHNSGRNRVQSPISDVFELLSWVLQIGERVSDITQELLGAKTNALDPSDPDALVMGWRPALIDSGRMVHWLEFFGAGLRSDGRTLLPQGLYVKLDTPTPDPKDWFTAEWFYNGIMYENETSLREAVFSPGFEKLDFTQDGEWTNTEEFGDSLPERNLPPPLSIQPYGPRYHLDRGQNYISWMGFSFYLSTTQSTAVSLFDIRYNSTRLIYELGLQEALAHYAGSEPLQSGLEFLDTFFGMGSMMFSLVPGVDCPGHAEYIDMSYHKGGKMHTNRNAICIFEYTSDAPLQRHTSAYSVSVSRNTYLVVRSVSTVGNYDYTIDYIFYLDGSIEVKVRASGFIFGAFHAEARSSPSSRDENTNEYGYRIHPAVHTSMHDHVLSFRADFDICGPKNTLARTSIEPLQRAYDWDKPEVSGVRNTMHMTHKAITHETGLDWPKNGGEMYLITNPNARNKWGETKAYRILPGTGMGNPSHLTILNSTALGRSAAWSSADLWVLRNHADTEPASAHHLNYLEPLDPLVDFEKMVDGEAIEEEDLVVYFNLGGHHVPNSQDIPNTLMHTSASSVLFMPFNYFDHDVSRAVRQGVRIDRRPEKDGDDKEEIKRPRRSGKATEVEIQKKKACKDEDVSYFGAHYTAPVTISEEMLSPDLSHYMKEREDGDAGEWKTARNRVGGGLFGLFVGKERDKDDEASSMWDW